MSSHRIALANLPSPRSPDAALEAALDAIGRAAASGAAIVAFPECFVPGYRWAGRPATPPDAVFLDRAWSAIARAARDRGVAVVLGTERIVDGALRASVLVIDADGEILGFQDKVQIDPSEEGTYAPGSGRRLFRSGALTFGVVICHEGFRYPETVRWAARRGAQVVFHSHLTEAAPGDHRPTTFAEAANTFHEKAMLCRAAENAVWFASVNCASEGSPTTSAIVRPDGSVQAWQPYGREGLLIADLDLGLATGLLARRWRPAD